MLGDETELKGRGEVINLILKTSYSNLRNLILTGINITEENIHFISTFLMITGMTESLSLDMTQLNDEKLSLLEESLGINTSLTFLNLQRNSITDRGIRRLYEVLNNNPLLTSIALHGNLLTQEAENSHIYWVQSIKSINQMEAEDIQHQVEQRGISERLARYSFSDSFLKSLMESIYNGNFLQISLDTPYLIKDSKSILHDILALNKIRELIITASDIYDESSLLHSLNKLWEIPTISTRPTLAFISLLSSPELIKNQFLERLELKFIHLDEPSSLETLKNYMRENTSLTSLAINYGNLQDTHMNAFSSIKMPLKSLTLNSNFISNKGFEILMTFLQTQSSLKEINLYNNYIKNPEEESYFRFLLSTDSSIKVDLRANFLGNEKDIINEEQLVRIKALALSCLFTDINDKPDQTFFRSAQDEREPSLKRFFNEEKIGNNTIGKLVGAVKGKKMTWMGVLHLAEILGGRHSPKDKLIEQANTLYTTIGQDNEYLFVYAIKFFSLFLNPEQEWEHVYPLLNDLLHNKEITELKNIYYIMTCLKSSQRLDFIKDTKNLSLSLYRNASNMDDVGSLIFKAPTEAKIPLLKMLADLITDQMDYNTRQYIIHQLMQIHPQKRVNNINRALELILPNMAAEERIFIIKTLEKLNEEQVEAKINYLKGKLNNIKNGYFLSALLRLDHSFNEEEFNCFIQVATPLFEKNIDGDNGVKILNEIYLLPLSLRDSAVKAISTTLRRTKQVHWGDSIILMLKACKRLKCNHLEQTYKNLDDLILPKIDDSFKIAKIFYDMCFLDLEEQSNIINHSLFIHKKSFTKLISQWDIIDTFKIIKNTPCCYREKISNFFTNMISSSRTYALTNNNDKNYILTYLSYLAQMDDTNYKLLTECILQIAAHYKGSDEKVESINSIFGEVLQIAFRNPCSLPKYLNILTEELLNNDAGSHILFIPELLQA